MSVGFDESLHKITQSCQMDLMFRYWDVLLITPSDHIANQFVWSLKFDIVIVSEPLLVTVEEKSWKVLGFTNIF